MENNSKLTLKIYWHYTIKHSLQFFAVVFSVIILRILDTLVPVYLKNFFNVLSAGGEKNVVAGQLMHILFIIAIIGVTNWALWRVATLAASALESRVIFELSNYCFQYLQKHSFGFFNNNFVGSLVKRVNRFTRSYETITDRVIFNILQLVTEVFMIVIILMRVNYILGVTMIAWTVLFAIVSFIFTQYKLKYDLQRSDADTKATGLLADTITNNANVKLFNGFDREVKSMTTANNEVRRLRLFTWNLSNVFEATQGGLSVMLELGLMYLAIRMWQKGILTVGDFILIQTYVLNIVSRIWDFGRIVQHMYEDFADADEMTKILNTPHEIVDIPKAKGLSVKTGNIIFDKISFYYHNTRPVFKNFNLNISPKEKVALVGPSGAGKTTIVKLILRMYELSSGKITIDNQDIAKVTQESLWKNISMVPQDPILFHRSLMENIRYGKPVAKDREVILAAKLAHCHEFISGFPDGYNTYVGERGVKLSGGERQRVAIARAILRNAPVLVLDEATSSLDSESEHYIQDALAHLMRDKTVIVIAHRLSTIMKMDRIVVIDGGKIVEEGTHKQLLENKSGHYYKLWNFQAGGFIQ